jgi:hypothetical protein
VEGAPFEPADLRSLYGLDMDSFQLGSAARRMLLADWFVTVATEFGLDFSQRGSSGETITIGNPTEFHVIGDHIEADPYLTFTASDPSQQSTVDQISQKAQARVATGDFGGVAWYSAELPEVDFQISPFSLLGPLLNRLGGQTRISGLPNPRS